jgi:Zn-dependent protease
MITKYGAAAREFYTQGFFSQDELNKRELREMLLISLAGPMTNIVLAAFFFLLFAFLLISNEAGSDLWIRAAYFAFFINIILAAFNMLPFGPLDGKKIFDGSRVVWALVGIPTILVGLLAYAGKI